MKTPYSMTREELSTEIENLFQKILAEIGKARTEQEQANQHSENAQEHRNHVEVLKANRQELVKKYYEPADQPHAEATPQLDE